MTAASHSELFLNTQNGAANAWTRTSSLTGAGYSRGLVALSDGHSVLVFNAGQNGTVLNSVYYSTVDLNGSGGNVLRAANANRCLDVPNSTSTNGTALNIWDCNGGANQRWTYNASTGTVVAFGNKCLDVPNHSTTPGARVQIWDCNGGGNQQWTLRADGSLVGRESGLCLDVVANGTANGTAVDIWTCNGGANQRWSQQ